MAVIKKDGYGLYAKVGGHIARPTAPSKFTEGQTVLGKHFGGSRTVGMGKLVGRSNYEEYWRTWYEDTLHDMWREYF